MALSRHSTPILPSEIWHEIGQVDPEVYWILVRTASWMSQDMLSIMDRFTQKRYNVIQRFDGCKPLTWAWVLPDTRCHNRMGPAATDGKILIYAIAGLLHSTNDHPSAIWPGNALIYHKNGKCHRDNDLPAVVYASGAQCWYKHGKIHRDNDLPAIVRADGLMEWWRNGIPYSFP